MCRQQAAVAAAVLVSVLQQSISFWHCRHSRARNTPFATTCIKVWDTYTHTKHLTQCCWHTVVVLCAGWELVVVCAVGLQIVLSPETAAASLCWIQVLCKLLAGHCGKCFNRCAYIREGLATHILVFPYIWHFHTHSLTINWSCIPQPQHHNHTTCQARVSGLEGGGAMGGFHWSVLWSVAK